MTRMKFSPILKSLLFVALVLYAFSACKDDKPTKPQADTGIVSGTVYSGAKSVLPGATVTIGDLTAITDNNGKFTLLGAPIGPRITLVFSKEGFIPNQKVVKVEKDRTTYTHSTLREPMAYTFASTVGGQLVDGSTRITIPDNAFVVGSTPFTGNIRAEYRYFDPTSPDNLNAFPGGFSGIQTDGSETLFESYGFIYASFTDAANPNTHLQLAPGKTAALRSLIPASLLENAPATIPMWYFNENTSKWMEEGVATRNGSYYEGEVSHFSYWNFDAPITVQDQSTLTGRVISASSKGPLAGAQVVATGVNYSGYTVTYTDANGLFSITVKAAALANLRAFAGINSSPVTSTITTPPSGQTQDVGDLVVSDLSFTITGILVDASNQPITMSSGHLSQVNTPDGDFPFGAWFQTDASGAFSAVESYNSSLSTFQVQFSVYQRNQLYSNRINFTVPQPGQVYNFGNVVMRQGGKLKGRAKDHQGNWITNNWVSFMQDNGQGEENYVSGETDENGYFILTGPPSTTLTNMRGSTYADNTHLESPLMNLNFPASGVENSIGTVTFSPPPR